MSREAYLLPPRRRRSPRWGGGSDEDTLVGVLVTEDGEAILTEDGRVASGDDVVLETEQR